MNASTSNDLNTTMTTPTKELVVIHRQNSNDSNGTETTAMSKSESSSSSFFSYLDSTKDLVHKSKEAKSRRLEEERLQGLERVQKNHLATIHRLTEACHEETNQCSKLRDTVAEQTKTMEKLQAQIMDLQQQLAAAPPCQTTTTTALAALVVDRCTWIQAHKWSIATAVAGMGAISLAWNRVQK